MAEANDTVLLKSMLNGLVKTHIALDINNRAQFVYQASASAIHGAPALVTEYVYSSPTSTTIVGTKEAQGVWDSSYDTSFTI